MGVPYNDPNTPPLELSMNPISNLLTPNAMYAHGERSSRHIFERQLVIPRLLIAKKNLCEFLVKLENAQPMPFFRGP